MSIWDKKFDVGLKKRFSRKENLQNFQHEPQFSDDVPVCRYPTNR